MAYNFAIRGMSFHDIPEVLMLEREAFGKMAWSSKDFESAISSSYDYPFVVHENTPDLQTSEGSSAVKSVYESTPDSDSHTALQPDIENTPDTCKETDFHVAGYGVLRILPPEAEVEDICVSSSMRMRGIGEKILQHMISAAREKGAENIYLEVRSKNEAAIGLYRKMGFQDSYVRKGYYRDPADDAVIMVLNMM